MLFLYIICERIKTGLFSPLTMGSRYLHTSLIIFHDYTLGVHQRPGKKNHASYACKCPRLTGNMTLVCAGKPQFLH